MATYEVGEEVQFVRQVSNNPNRVINIDEKAQIVSVDSNGSYTVKMLSGESISGITDDDLEPSAEMPGDSLPTDNQTHPGPTSASTWTTGSTLAPGESGDIRDG